MERVRLEVRVLMALGRKDEVQDLRWRTFEALLDVEILRDYVAHLGDFEEFDALERAFGHVMAHADGHRALAFLLTWPRLEHAATLVVERRDTWAGQHYGLLLPAAQALEQVHPVAATVLYRVLLDDILRRARSPAYGHAVRYLAKLDEIGACDLATAGLTEHEPYRAELRRSHGRKSGFWSLIEGVDLLILVAHLHQQPLRPPLAKNCLDQVRRSPQSFMCEIIFASHLKATILLSTIIIDDHLGEIKSHEHPSRLS